MCPNLRDHYKRLPLWIKLRDVGETGAEKVKQYTTEIKKDAEYQTDPKKKVALNELASAIEAAAENPSNPEKVVVAGKRLKAAITNVDQMEGSFIHVEKEIYLVGRIFLILLSLAVVANWPYAIIQVLERAADFSGRSEKDIIEKTAGLTM